MIKSLFCEAEDELEEAFEASPLEGLVTFYELSREGELDDKLRKKWGQIANETYAEEILGSASNSSTEKPTGSVVTKVRDFAFRLLNPQEHAMREAWKDGPLQGIRVFQDLQAKGTIDDAVMRDWSIKVNNAYKIFVEGNEDAAILWKEGLWLPEKKIPLDDVECDTLTWFLADTLKDYMTYRLILEGTNTYHIESTVPEFIDCMLLAANYTADMAMIYGEEIFQKDLKRAREFAKSPKFTVYKHRNSRDYFFKPQVKCEESREKHLENLDLLAEVYNANLGDNSYNPQILHEPFEYTNGMNRVNKWTLEVDEYLRTLK